jgi:outer membrane protein
MKKIIYLLVFAVFYGNIFAQVDTYKLSLSQSIQLGLKNRFDAKESRLNIDIAENKQAKSQKGLLPDISASGKVTYNGQLQPTIVPAGLLGFTKAEKIDLGMKNNTSLSFDFNYNIYKPGLYTDIQIASNNLDLEKEKNIKNNIDIKIEIIEAYNDVLLKSLQYEIAQQNRNRYKEYYELSNGKFNNGALLESDMLQAELDFKNATANAEKYRQNYILSIQNFKHKINVPLQSIIILTDSLHAPAENDINQNISNNATTNRSEIKQLMIQHTGYELQIKKAKENYFPTLSIFASYTQLFQGSKFDYSNSFYWSPINYIGVKLSIPITESIKNINSVEQYKLEMAQNSYNMEQKTSDVIFEVQEAMTNLDNAKQNLTVANNNFILSQKVYELKKQQYNSGSFSYEKLLDTEKSLSTTEQEYVIAVYNYIIAKINYQKAAGSF